MEEHEFMTVPEVAAALRVSKGTVYSMIRTGELEAIQPGRAFRIRTASFKAFKDGHTDAAPQL